MIGGDGQAVERLAPIWNCLAPGMDAVERTPGRTGESQPGERGWLHCGPPGAGHFVKMVHNGIEYGMMAALAEGLAILDAADAGLGERALDAETSPLRDPLAYRYDLDLPAITEVWRRGSVISSWLVDLTAKALVESPDLADLQGRVSDSGEGRWTVEAAVDLGVPAQVITASLYQRFATRDRFEVGARVLSAMRREFGGHGEMPPDESLPVGDELTVVEPDEASR
jgi:6-phosphogluconate dehydrogenase